MIILKRLVAPLAVLMAAAGCSFTGVNSYTLPFNAGGGSDAITATVRLENTTNLVANSEVKYQEITVGSVRKIELDGWQPVLTIGLDADARVPADVTANVAQKSLLGAQYLELLKVPEADESTLLADGAVLGLERTGRYPETEEVLTAASMLLNGGGLPAVRTIALEANAALTGREDDVTSLISQIDQASGTLTGQIDSITGALGQLDVLTSTINAQTQVVDEALMSLPEGADVLSQEEDQLLAALQSLQRLQAVTDTGLADNGDALGQILDDLVPVTDALVEVERLAPIFESFTYPFPTSTVRGITRSDWLNLSTIIHVDAEDLANRFLGLNQLDGLLSGLLDGAPLEGASGATDPFTAPLDGVISEDPLDLVDGLLPPPTTAAPGDSAPSGPAPSPAPSLLRQLLGGR